MGLVKPAFFCVSANLLISALCYGVNRAFDQIPTQSRYFGTLALFAQAFVVFHLYAALFRPAHVSKFTYHMVVLFFGMTCFDLTTVVDFQRRPNTLFLTNYLNNGDPIVCNAHVDSTVYLDVLGPHLFHFIILYRMFNRLSWRSLELFNSGVWFTMLPPFFYPMMTPQITQYADRMHISKFLGIFVPFVALVIIVTLSQTRQNDLGAGAKGEKGRNQSTAGFFASGLFKLVNFTLILATVGLIAYESLVTLDLEKIHPSLNLNKTLNLNLKEDYLRKNSPVLFFQPLKNMIEFGVINLYIYIVLVLPILLLNLVFAFKRSGHLPSFLWDLNVFQAGILYCGQGYLLVAPFLHNVPKAYRVDPANAKFWAINLLPVVTALVNVLALTPFRRRVIVSKSAGKNVERKKRV